MQAHLRLLVAGPGDRTALWLLLETLAAIGFAFGLALAIARIAEGRSPLSGAVLLVLFAGLRGVAALGGAAAGAKRASTTKLELRRRMLAAGLRDPLGIASDRLASGAIDAIEALDGYVARFLPARRAASVAPALVLIATGIASPVSAAILMATLVPLIVALALAGSLAAEESRRQFAALARLSGHFADRVRALPVVLAFRAEQREAATLSANAEQLAERTMRVLRLAFLSSASLEFFAALSVALVAVYCGFGLLHILPFPAPERLDLFRGFFVLALAPEFYAPLRRLAAAYHDRQAAEGAAEVLGDLLDTKAVLAKPIVLAVPPRIDYADVAIRYPVADAPAVSDFSLVVEPGEFIALCGPSGSGKSSLLRLLLGLAPLAGGEVWIDDQALSQLGGIAAGASWVGQDTLLFGGTIRDNLLLTAPEASTAMLEDAIAAVGLEEAIGHRVDGAEAILDARGSGLSGGERRRIALARALLKPAAVLLLDEPTAHLDRTAESEMIALIRRIARGRTTLIATHSAELAAIADRVVQL